GSDIVTEFFARLEYAAALSDVRSLERVGEQLVSAAEITVALTDADRSADRLESHAGGVVGGVTMLGGETSARDAVQSQLAQVRDVLAHVWRLSDSGSGMAGLLTDELMEELSMSFLEVLTVPREELAPDSVSVTGSATEEPALLRWATHGAADTAS